MSHYLSKTISLVITSLLLYSCQTDSQFALDPYSVNFNGAKGGCGSFSIYSFNEQGDIALSINGKKDSLPLVLNIPIKIQLPSPYLSLAVKEYNQNAYQLYCNDIMYDHIQLLHDWKAIEGQIEITLLSKPDTILPFWDRSYQLSTKIISAKLQHSDPNTEKDTELSNIKIDSINVGWYPG